LIQVKDLSPMHGTLDTLQLEAFSSRKRFARDPLGVNWLDKIAPSLTSPPATPYGPIYTKVLSIPSSNRLSARLLTPLTLGQAEAIVDVDVPLV